MTEYPLLSIPKPEISDRLKLSSGGNNLKKPGRRRQGQRLGPVFQRLQNVFDEGRDPLTLREDPSAIAPERALVFEVAGSINGFARAVDKILGLEYLGEEETSYDPDLDFAFFDMRKGKEGQLRSDKPVAGRLYLSMPDVQALQQLVSLWNKYQSSQQPERGFRLWFDVFEQLHNLRPWGPLDRITDDMSIYIKEKIESNPDTPLRLEIELWSYAGTVSREKATTRFEQAVRSSNGMIISRASIPEIAYEAALIDLPAGNAHQLSQRSDIPLAICDDVMWVRPQTTLSIPTDNEPLEPDEYVEPAKYPKEQPIVALLDGMPVQEHQRLKNRVIIDDPDGLDAKSVVDERHHGTAMASLILHGDLNRNEPVLPRPLYIRPVIYAPGNKQSEKFLHDCLPIDTIYRAVLRMKEGDNEGGPTAKDAFIVNLSLGDINRPFANLISPWARLLDYLAERFGILFIVSAGNIPFPLEISGFINSLDWSRASPKERQESILQSLKEQRSQRTLLSPAEALNVITVGSWHDDNHIINNQADDTKPYMDSGPNITSAMGLGYRKIIKPDIFMPGGKETLQTHKSRTGIIARPDRTRFGLRVATTSMTGNLDYTTLTNGTSAATALATRAGHRIFDSLLDNGLMDNVDPMFYGVIIKALLAHRAKWDQEIGIMLDNIYGPHGSGKHVERKDNIASVIGFGHPNTNESITCAPNRVTLVGSGIFENTDISHLYHILLPPSLERITEPRSVTITLAWFSPINVRSRNYRDVRLEAKAQNFETEAGVSRAKLQPSDKSTPRGTLFHVRYEGKKSVVLIKDGHLLFNVFCRAQENNLDKPARYGLAVTIEAGEHIPVYQEVREWLAVAVRAEG